MLTAGIDVGSRTIKVVILKGYDDILGKQVVSTGINSTGRAERVLNGLLQQVNYSRDDLDYIIATGYGRINIAFADEKVTEISCHAAGAYAEFPGARTIIDIGGQDCKVIRLDKEGRVEDFLMNDKCAAGTGRFLEVMAENLEIPLTEIGEVSLQTRKAAAISSTCTVFAESEVVGLVARGVPRAEILRGLHKSIVKRLTGMVYRVGLEEEVVLTGGVCLNSGVRKILGAELDINIKVPQYPQLAGALGAAKLAWLNS